jgi:hypothetical protein
MPKISLHVAGIKYHLDEHKDCIPSNNINTYESYTLICPKKGMNDKEEPQVMCNTKERGLRACRSQAPTLLIYPD